MPDPVFEVKSVGGRDLVTCMIGEFSGAARIFSDGLDRAKERAEIQARALWKKANPE